MPYTSVPDAGGHDQTCPEVAANLKRPGESLFRDDNLLPKKQCVSSPMSGPDILSRLPTELKSQIFFEVSDRETLVNLSRVSKPFRAVFDMSRLEFLCSAYAEVISIGMESAIIAQFVSRQRELIGRGVLEGQQDNAYFVLERLRRYHRELYRLEGKKKHNDNLTEVLPAMVDLDVRERRWSNGYQRVRDFMHLEDGGRYSRHADFHGGVQNICYPSTCRHTADAYDLIRVLKEICRNLISEGQQVEACRAISVFGHMPLYYKHIAGERLERVRSMWRDKWPGDRLRALTPLWEVNPYSNC